jgi:thiopeptide-type bacteriocin biosynthesis protein
MNEILSRLNLEIHEKLFWIQSFNDNFKKEFNADKNLNSQLDKKYRKFKSKLIKFMQSDEFLDERSAIVSHVDECNSTFQNILQQHQNQSLEISLQSFFQSIFHMNINRLFVSDQRLFEMVIYDYLLRYYKSVMYFQAYQK